LIGFYVDNNYLTSLPETISQFTNLSEGSIDNNCILTFSENLTSYLYGIAGNYDRQLNQTHCLPAAMTPNLGFATTYGVLASTFSITTSTTVNGDVGYTTLSVPLLTVGLGYTDY